MATQVTPELQRMLEEAAKRGASDLHLVPGEPPVYRVREKLVREEGDPLSEEEVLEIVHAAVGVDQASRIGAELETVIATCSLPGVVEGRMCITRHLDKLTVEVRLLPSGVPDPVAGRVPKALLEATESPRGLILITGLTGSGKNTVALMLLEHINANRAVHIVTIEDPVAVHMAPKQALIRQQSVGTDTPSIHGALRAVLRLDPDVIYVSDIRDVVTLQACVMAVQTGHLVIAVVHGPSPQGLIQLMIDLQPEEMRAMFRRSLAGAIRAVGMSCLLPAASGQGRLAAYAVLVPDEAMRQAIAEGRDIGSWSPLPPGSQTLAEDVERLVAEGKVTKQAAREALERVKQG